jgi:molecular chaperone GrpE (heat shock protein)
VGRPLFAALAVVALVAGCGGGSEAPRLSSAQFASRADAICRTYNSRSNAIAQPNSLAELATAINKLVPLLDQSIEKLQKLSPPKDEQADVEKWLAGVQRLEDDLRSVQASAAKKDEQGVRAALESGDAHNKRSNAMAAKLGLTVCSQ